MTCPCAHFDAICDLLLHRRTVPRKLFAKVIIFTRLLKFPRVLLRKRESGSRVCCILCLFVFYLFVNLFFNQELEQLEQWNFFTNFQVKALRDWKSSSKLTSLVTGAPPAFNTINPLNPKNDQHLISPYNISLNHTIRSWELWKWSPTNEAFDQ